MKKLLLLITALLATSMGLLAQGTSWQTATLISSGQTKTATLDASTTEVWYKINVTTEGKVQLTVTGTEDLRFYSYNSVIYGFKDDAIITRGHFSGNLTGSYGDTITYQASDVGKGTYYINIKRYSGSGSFKLKYTFTQCQLSNDPEPNNEYTSASLLQSGSTVQGRLGYRSSDDVTDTQDWYKIVVPEEGQVEFTVTATEDLKFYPYYCTFNGYKNNDIYRRSNFTGNTGNYSDTITFKATDVGAGTYYICLQRNSGNGGYRLHYKFTPCPQSADPEANNDFEHSTLLESGKTVQGRLGYRSSDDVTDTQDWYKIVVPEEGQVEFTVTATADLKFYPYYCTFNGYKDNNIYRRSNFTGNSGNYSDTITFKATDVGKGTYYICLQRNNGSGGYKLYYKFTPCPQENDFEPDDDYQHYNRLLNGKTSEGRLGYRTSDDVTDNQDWYRIIVPKDGDIDISANVASNDLKLYPYYCEIYSYQNNNLNKLSSFSGNAGSYSTTITYQKINMTAGIYYIRLSRNGGSGGYTIRYNGPVSDIPGDVDGDGQVNIGDISDISDYLLYGDPANPLPNGDADGDGKITIGDVTTLIDKLLQGM